MTPVTGNNDAGDISYLVEWESRSWQQRESDGRGYTGWLWFQQAIDYSNFINATEWHADLLSRQTRGEVRNIHVFSRRTEPWVELEIV